MTLNTQRWLNWLLIALLAIFASYAAFRAYPSPGMLLNFASIVYC